MNARFSVMPFLLALKDACAIMYFVIIMYEMYHEIMYASNGRIIIIETAVCAHERSLGTRQHERRHAMSGVRTEGAAPNEILP